MNIRDGNFPISFLYFESIVSDSHPYTSIMLCLSWIFNSSFAVDLWILGKRSSLAPDPLACLRY